MSKKVTFGTTPKTQAPLPASADKWVDGSEAAPTESPVTSEAIKRLTLDIPESLHRRIKAQCAANGVKMVDAIRKLLEEKFTEK